MHACFESIVFCECHVLRFHHHVDNRFNRHFCNFIDVGYILTTFFVVRTCDFFNDLVGCADLFSTGKFNAIIHITDSFFATGFVTDDVVCTHRTSTTCLFT